MAAWWPYQIFLFPDSNFSLALNINSKLQRYNTYIYGLEPIDFQEHHFQNGRLAAILFFSVSGLCRRYGFRSLSQFCFGGSISNFICILMVVIGRSLLIFRDITFKMAAWQPFWNFWFPDSNFHLAVSINSKLQWHNTYMGRSLLIFNDINFKIVAWQPYWIFWFLDSSFSLALNSTYVYG